MVSEIRDRTLVSPQSVTDRDKTVTPVTLQCFHEETRKSVTPSSLKKEKKVSV